VGGQRFDSDTSWRTNFGIKVLMVQQFTAKDQKSFSHILWMSRQDVTIINPNLNSRVFLIIINQVWITSNNMELVKS